MDIRGFGSSISGFAFPLWVGERWRLLVTNNSDGHGEDTEGLLKMLVLEFMESLLKTVGRLRFL
jgi:hypothetical protein